MCKKPEISEYTYYRWRKEDGGLRLDQAASPHVYRPRILGQWCDGIRFYAAASSPTKSRRT